MQANRILDAAGYAKSPDTHMRFSLVYRNFENAIQGNKKTVRLIKESLAKIGIELIVEEYSYNQMEEMAVNDRNWDIANSYGLRGPDPSAFADAVVSEGVDNIMMYSCEELDELFALALIPDSRIERGELYAKAQHILARDIPMCNLVELSMPRAYNLHFKGYYWQVSSGVAAEMMSNTVEQDDFYDD
jgi:ABC-type transport system substrate-binding protein